MSGVDSPISKTSDYRSWLHQAYAAYYPTEKDTFHVPALPCPKELRPNDWENWYIYPRNRKYGFIVLQSTIDEIKFHNYVVASVAIVFLLVSFFALWICMLADVVPRGTVWTWSLPTGWLFVVFGGIFLLTRPLRRIFSEHKPIYFPEEFTIALKKRDRNAFLLRSAGQVGGSVMGGALEVLQVNKALAKVAEIGTASIIDRGTEHLQSHSEIGSREVGQVEDSRKDRLARGSD